MESVLEKVKKDQVKYIELQFTDIFGSLKSIEMPVETIEDAFKKGVWFDGSSIKGFARIMESDMYLKPDPKTYTVLSREDEKTITASFFCDVYTPENKLFEGSPRAVLKKAIEEAKELGYDFFVGPEVEFYLFEPGEGGFSIPKFDTFSYFDSGAGDVGSKIRKEIMHRLKDLGVESERAHHEVGEGQHEIGFRYGEALETAERVMNLKKVIKSVAHKHGLVASFMPKPLFGKAGSGMHVHFSLFDKKGSPVFFDSEEKHCLSKTGQYFIAGILKHIKGISLLLNPTVNSYKRLVKGYEAPVYICWGSKNRSALIRMPKYTKGRESSVRGEIRSPDPSSCPYLVFSAILKAGLDGIKNKEELPKEVDDSVYDLDQTALEAKGIGILPGSIDEALEHFKKSSLARELMGDNLFLNYYNAKKLEAEEYKISVTEWERERYLEKC